MAARRAVVGYEYNYAFSIVEELVSRYSYQVSSEMKTLLLEIRTSFIMRTIDGQDEIIDREVFDAQVLDDGDDSVTAIINMEVSYRLKEYWMTEEEIRRFELQVLNFARRAAAVDPSGQVIPIVVTMEVRTVQQKDEPIELAMERVLRAEKLVPFFIWPSSSATAVERLRYESDFLCFLMELPRNRVEDIDVGLNIMRDCGICLQRPTIGDQISVLPSCTHAFHSHCIVRCLLEDKEKLCPLCHSLAYHPSMDY